MRAELVEAETHVRYPIRGTFFGCCASAMTRKSKQHHCNKD